MEIEIYDGTQPAGNLSMTQQGLYLHLQGSLTEAYSLYRVYGICGDGCTYLGIVDPCGKLSRRISASSSIPWEYCLLSPLPPQEFIFAPKEETEEPETNNTDSDIQVNPEREEPQQTQQREKTERGKKYETDEEMLGSAIDPLLLADLPADYDYGQGGQSEAHCHHL